MVIESGRLTSVRRGSVRTHAPVLCLPTRSSLLLINYLGGLPQLPLRVGGGGRSGEGGGGGRVGDGRGRRERKGGRVCIGEVEDGAKGNRRKVATRLRAIWNYSAAFAPRWITRQAALAVGWAGLALMAWSCKVGFALRGGG